jgi:hypothetical protein
MAKLTTAERNALPSSEFADPKDRKYPINDPNHARNALARVANKSEKMQGKVESKVHDKFPGVDQGDKAKLARMQERANAGPGTK